MAHIYRHIIIASCHTARCLGRVAARMVAAFFLHRYICLRYLYALCPGSMMPARAQRGPVVMPAQSACPAQRDGAQFTSYWRPLSNLSVELTHIEGDRVAPLSININVLISLFIGSICRYGQ